MLNPRGMASRYRVRPPFLSLQIKDSKEATLSGSSLACSGSRLSGGLGDQR